MSELDIPPWQLPETAPATTELLDQGPFATEAGRPAGERDGIGVLYGADQRQAELSNEAAGSPAADAGTLGHLWADWHPVFRGDQEESGLIPGSAGFGETGWPALAAQSGENQVPPAKPSVTKTFPAEALTELPDALGAKPLADIQATVPTEKILWMISDALANRGSEPGWADRLLVDLEDLPKAAPSATVHVTIFETVPLSPGDQAKLRAFHRFCMKAYASKELPFDALTVADYTRNRWLEERLDLPAGSVAQTAGLPTRMAANQAVNYKLVVYAMLPRGAGMVIAPRDHRALRGFAFDKATLTPGHEKMLDSLAREVVRSWYSRSMVTKVVIQGHTDLVGTSEYNYALGRARAEAVAARLKQLINRYAGPLPTGTVDRIQYVVESYGKDRPFSTRLNSLNRRVELTLYRDTSPPPTPLKLDETLPRLTSLLTSQSLLDGDTVDRLRCMLSKLQQPGTDDRFATDTQVFLINRDNQLPGAADWNRVLSRVLTPEVFGPQVPDDRVIAALGRLDLAVAEGIAKTNQMVAYASGIDLGLGPLGLMALSDAFKKYNDWQFARLHDSTSVYSCYASLFL
jgi:outer membrane protein OmpA-like peptidoglycan-associated protein